MQFIISLFTLVLQVRNGPWALWEKNALKLANQSVRYISYKQKPYSNLDWELMGKTCLQGYNKKTRNAFKHFNIKLQHFCYFFREEV